MYSTSTQKKHWTFASVDDLNAQRLKTSDEYKQKINSGDHMEVDSVENEAELLKSVTEMGVRFADEFEPKMWPAVKWTAFAYFKRFYLRHSAAEFSPKIIIVACYYLAMKIQEFNVSIHDFTKNLKSESLESNAEEILHWEPILIHRLNYQLTVHCPFRPLEGHLMELKTFGKLRFDVEAVRPHTSEFFRKCLFGDVMLLYPPTHIALAALSYGLQKLGKGKDIFRDYILRLCQVDSSNPNIENVADKLLLRVEQICDLVKLSA